jgi:hypothetical protein
MSIKRNLSLISKHIKPQQWTFPES